MLHLRIHVNVNDSVDLIETIFIMYVSFYIDGLYRLLNLPRIRLRNTLRVRGFRISGYPSFYRSVDRMCTHPPDPDDVHTSINRHNEHRPKMYPCNTIKYGMCWLTKS